MTTQTKARLTRRFTGSKLFHAYGLGNNMTFPYGVGTSNKTELLLGYGTLFGDMAAAVNPLGDLYKTQVRQLAAHLGVPQPIIDKPPSAERLDTAWRTHTPIPPITESDGVTSVETAYAIQTLWTHMHLARGLRARKEERTEHASLTT